jgi:hypothetical protein
MTAYKFGQAIRWTAPFVTCNSGHNQLSGTVCR